MKKKEAVEKALENLPIEDIKPGPRDPKDEERQRMKPSLLKRIFSGLLDVLIAGIFVAGIQAAMYFTIYYDLGYHDALNTIHELQENSHLYVTISGYPVTIDNAYDKNKTIEENYDTAITYYYTTDSRCKETTLYNNYVNRKCEKYYVYDGTSFNRTDACADEKLQKFFEAEYETALNFFSQNEVFVNAANKSFTITFVSLTINVMIISTIYYFVIPLANKRKQTFGQWVFKIFVVDKDTLEPETTRQHFLRFVIYDIIAIISPITLYMFLPEIFALPILIHIAILSFSYTNCGIHDYAANTFVGNISRTNSSEILNDLRKLGDQENGNTINK